MVLHVSVDPGAQDKLRELREKGEASTGVLVGATTASNHLVVYIAETPSPEDSEGEVAYPDVTWLVEHAKQVVRMLPGGFTVLGFLLATNEDPFRKDLSSKLRKLVTSCSRLCKSTPDQILVAHASLSSSAVTCKSMQVSGTDATFKPSEWQVSSGTLQWLQLDSSLVLDLPLTLAAPEDQPMLEQLNLALKPFVEKVEKALCVMDNKFVDGASRLLPQAEKESGKKRGKGKAKSEETENDPPVLEKQNWTVDFLFRDDVYEDVSVEETNVRMRLVGKIACRAYVDPLATVEEAEVAIKQDLLRSLMCRLVLHCDSLVGDENKGTSAPEMPVIHEPPRRVFVSLPQSRVAISDYLYPGEGSEDCVGSVKELFGFTPSDDGIEDDVEIVASPKEIDGSGQNSDSKLASRRKAFKCGSTEMVLSVAVGLLSAGFAYFTLVVDP